MQTEKQIINIKEAIILAGGLGTRLRRVVPDLPKCMASVAGKPFLSYVIDYFQEQGIERFIFSLGYRHEQIEHFIRSSYPGLDSRFSVEKEPLGTGGAVKLACAGAETENLLVLNGDTLYQVDLATVAAFHYSHRADCTLSLKPMQHFDRYGTVETDAASRVSAFKEKQPAQKGLINGGVYLLNKAAFQDQGLPAEFSFEKHYLEAQIEEEKHKIFGIIQEQYFIDIGIPEDFDRAQNELPEFFTRGH